MIVHGAGHVGGEQGLDPIGCTLPSAMSCNSRLISGSSSSPVAVVVTLVHRQNQPILVVKHVRLHTHLINQHLTFVGLRVGQGERHRQTGRDETYKWCLTFVVDAWRGPKARGDARSWNLGVASATVSFQDLWPLVLVHPSR